MSKAVINLSDLYEFKLCVSFKSLVWYRAPVNISSTARINLFNHKVNVGFGNQTSLGIKEVEYQIRDSLQLQNFYKQKIIIEIVNMSENEEQVVGYCELDPKIVTEKSIIAPIVSVSCSYFKIGDIQIQFKLTKSVTDLDELRQINSYLDNLIENKPQEFDILYHQLINKGVVSKINH